MFEALGLQAPGSSQTSLRLWVYPLSGHKRRSRFNFMTGIWKPVRVNKFLRIQILPISSSCATVVSGLANGKGCLGMDTRGNEPTLLWLVDPGDM